MRKGVFHQYLYQVAVALIALSLFWNPNLLFAQSTSKDQIMPMPVGLHAELKSATRSLNTKRNATSVKFTIQTPQGPFPVELVPHDIRAKHYRAEKTTVNGRIADDTQVSLFKMAGAGESSRYFTRFALIEVKDREPEIIGYMRRNNINYRVRQDKANNSQLLVGSLNKKEADAIIASCSEGIQSPESPKVVATSSIQSRNSTRSSLKMIELATEADYDYYSDEGSTASANATILAIVNAVDAIYRSELSLAVSVVYQHTWSSSSDPYTKSDSVELLKEFRSYWNSNFSSSVTYDLAHLWTGRNLDGSTAGVAWVGATCSSYRYGLSQRYSSTGTTVPLLAHEMGHNVGADHDDTPCASDAIMCPSLHFNADSFSDAAKTSVAAHVSTASCLSSVDSATVSLSINNSSISESGGSATVTATLSNTVTSAVTVQLAFSGTANSASDYTRSSSSITISAGSTTGSITISASSDVLDEDNETVIVDISSVTNASENGTQSVTTTIVDNDDPPSVSLSAGSTSISETGGITTITAIQSAVSGKNVTVNLGFTGTASGTDYVASANSITINAGSTSGLISISSVSDTTDESNETVITSISSLTNANIGSPSSRTVTINDDDDAPSVSLSLSSSSIGENGGTTVLSANLSNKSDSTVTVYLSYSGTASAGEYSGAASSIAIAPGQLSGSITLASVNDSTDESNETIIIDITSVTNGTEFTTQTKTITIVDDDATPQATITASPNTVSENGGVSTIGVALSNTSDKTITIGLSFSGTASASDYNASSSSISIAPGATSGSITITGQSDGRDELNEIVVVDIASVTNAAEFGVQRTTVTLTDEDPTPSITLSASSNSIAENGGSSTLTVLSNAVSNLDITVNFQFSGTVGGFDYGVSATSTTIPAGSTSSTIVVNSNDDLEDESDETVIVDISSVSNGVEFNQQQEIITIVDDDIGADITVDSLLTNDTSPELSGTISTTTASIEISVNGKSYVADNNSDGTWTLADNSISPALATGIYSVVAESTTPGGITKIDSSNNELTIDTIAPATTVDSLATQDTTPALSGTIDDPSATLTVMVNGKTYPGNNLGNGTWSLADNTISPALAENIYEVQVDAEDSLGNSATDSTSNELKVDLSAPVVTVNSKTTSVNSPELTGTVNETDASISVRVNGGTYTASNLGNGTWKLVAGAIAALPLGTYEVEVEATDPAGNKGNDSTNNELTIEEADSDGDGLKDSSDNCPNDSNADQADDDEDGIGNVCDGSHALPSSPAFIKWTSFLKQWSFLELVVQGTEPLSASVTVYNLAGQQMIQQSYTVAANSETDVDINALVRLACESVNPSSCAGLVDLDADGMIDSYGLVRVDFDDSNPNAKLIGRLSNYRPDPSHLAAPGGSFSFALTRELRPLLRGTTFAVANTFDPQGLGYLVPNWSELTYIGSASGSGSMGFTINLYDQSGALKKSEYVVLNELQERDSAAGHDIVDSVTGVVVQAVYLVEVIPDDPSKPYLFSVTRYSSNSPAGIEPQTYNYSVTAPGRAGADAELYSSISREFFSCGTVINWVEVANTTNSAVAASLTFRNSVGNVVGTTTDSIAAKAQNHYNASAMLALGDVGSVEISSNVSNSLIATSMVYILECDRSGIQTAYAAMAREVGRKNQSGSVNTFLSMSNILRVVSTKTGSQSIAVGLQTYLGETSSGSLSPAAKGALDEQLLAIEGYTLPSDRYGTVNLTGGGSQQYLGEVLRMRFKQLDAKTRVDFVIPTQVN